MNSKFERVATASDRIKEALAMRKMRQADLVRATGIDKGSISYYISGKYEPKNEAVYKMAKALNVADMWLWGYDVPMERPLSQKQADELADIVERIKKDQDFKSLVLSLDHLNPDQLELIKGMIEQFNL